jgi:hypothetical protein
MDEHQWMAERFEAERPHLQAVAYRMLGSLSEADDAVQESWLRLSRSETSGIDNLGGWLTTVVAHICLDLLRQRRSRREESLEAVVPEAIESREEGSTQSRKRCWPTRSGWRCWSCSTRSLPPSGWPSCCTTSSRCLSTRLRLSWSVRRRQQGSSRVAPAAACGERKRRSLPISNASEQWSMPSLLPREPETLMRCSRCSTRRLCSAPTMLPHRRARKAWSRARRSLPDSSQDVLRVHEWLSWMESWQLLWHRVDICSWSSISRSGTTRSSRLRRSPIPHACASCTLPSSTTDEPPPVKRRVLVRWSSPCSLEQQREHDGLHAL